MLSYTKVTIIQLVFAALLLHLFLVTGIEANPVALKVPHATDVDQELNITTSVQDFVIQNQRQYAANIVSMDQKLAAFKFNYESELKTIITQRDLFLQKLDEVDKKLYPLRFLNNLEKHCVQKYEGKISTIASANTSITNCATTALNQYNSYAAAPTATRTSLNVYYTDSLPIYLGRCKTNNPNLESQNYTICVTKEIADADARTVTAINKFNTEMQTAHCAAEGRVRTAIDCSFSIIFARTKTVGETLSLIDRCSQGLEFCPKCDEKPVYYCPNQLSVSLNASDYRSPTIRNPFYGLTGKIDCVLLNLGVPSWN